MSVFVTSRRYRQTNSALECPITRVRVKVRVRVSSGLGNTGFDDILALRTSIPNLTRYTLSLTLTFT